MRAVIIVGLCFCINPLLGWAMFTFWIIGAVCAAITEAN